MSCGQPEIHYFASFSSESKFCSRDVRSSITHDIEIEGSRKYHNIRLYTKDSILKRKGTSLIKIQDWTENVVTYHISAIWTSRVMKKAHSWNCNQALGMNWRNWKLPTRKHLCQPSRIIRESLVYRQSSGYGVRALSIWWWLSQLKLLNWIIQWSIFFKNKLSYSQEE